MQGNDVTMVIPGEFQGMIILPCYVHDVVGRYTEILRCGDFNSRTGRTLEM